MGLASHVETGIWKCTGKCLNASRECHEARSEEPDGDAGAIVCRGRRLTFEERVSYGIRGIRREVEGDMRHALIVASVLCGLGFGTAEASARPVHHRTAITK